MGNKADMEFKVDREHVENFCRNAGLSFYYVSAKTGEGVDEMFTDLSQNLIKVSKMRQPLKKTKKNKKLKSSFLPE